MGDVAYCANCGRGLTPGSFCIYCGAKIPDFIPASGVTPSAPTPRPPASPFLIGVALAIIIVIIPFGVYLAYLTNKDQEQRADAQRAWAAIAPAVAPIPFQPQPPPPPQSHFIVNTAFTVAPAYMTFYPFEVTRPGSRVTGSFRASGGKNDIQVLILTADELENFKNGNASRSFYNSDWVTVGNIDVRLPQGSYYLVFNNLPALFTNKVVTASIELTEP